MSSSYRRMSNDDLMHLVDDEVPVQQKNGNGMQQQPFQNKSQWQPIPVNNVGSIGFGSSQTRFHQEH